jgi:hypothetical protein
VADDLIGENADANSRLNVWDSGNVKDNFLGMVMGVNAPKSA